MKGNRLLTLSHTFSNLAYLRQFSVISFQKGLLYNISLSQFRAPLLALGQNTPRLHFLSQLKHDDNFNDSYRLIYNLPFIVPTVIPQLSSKKPNFRCRTFSSATSADSPTLAIREVDNSGRGIFTTHHLPAGSEVLTAIPVVSHPSPHATDSCFHCLRPLAPSTDSAAAGVDRATQLKGLEEESIQRSSFCSPACEDLAQGYETLQKASGLQTFISQCRSDGRKFSLVIVRLALQVLSGQARSDVLAPLCFAKTATDQPPQQWVEEWEAVRTALESSVAVPGETNHNMLDFFTLEWYVLQQAKLHLNAFKVELVQYPRDHEGLLRAAAGLLSDNPDSLGGTTVGGTAVYLLPSFLNHSCDPNIGTFFQSNNHTMTLRTRRDIEPGEELYITYIDAHAAVQERQKQLYFGYGFHCKCPRCMEES